MFDMAQATGIFMPHSLMLQKLTLSCIVARVPATVATAKAAWPNPSIYKSQGDMIPAGSLPLKN
jgi:hypothetical protein